MQKKATKKATNAVRINDPSREILRELVAQTGESMTRVLELALKAFRRRVFFEQMNRGYAELRSDPTAWAKADAERKDWDATLMDGLDKDESWTESKRPRPRKDRS